MSDSERTLCAKCGSEFDDSDKLHRHKKHVHGGSEDEYISAIQDLADELGDVPTLSEMDEYGRFSHYTYDSNFESWNAALRKAGLSPNREYDTPREQLITDLKQLADELNRVPRVKDMDRHGPHSAAKYFHPDYGHFERWSEAIEAAGLTPNAHYNVTREDALAELRRLSDEFDQSPTIGLLTEHGQYGAGTVQRLFDQKWVDIVREAGLDPAQSGKGEAEGFDYGHGWNKDKRRTVRRRDGFECYDCGVSQKEYSEQFVRDQSLSVHHIVPATKIENPETRNSPLNLITLCEACHTRWEAANGLCPPEIELPFYVNPPTQELS